MPDCLSLAPFNNLRPHPFCTWLNQVTDYSNLLQFSCCFQSLRHFTSSCSVLHRSLTFPIAVSTQLFIGVLVHSFQKDLGKFYSATGSIHGQSSTPRRVRLSQMPFLVILILYPQRCDQPLNQPKNGWITWHNLSHNKHWYQTTKEPGCHNWISRSLHLDWESN